MPDVANIKSGPFQFLIDIAGTLTDVGYTKGGLRVAITPRIGGFTVDQLGDTEVRRVVRGVDARVSFSVAEVTLDNLKRALLNSVPLQDDVTATKKKLSIRPKAGQALTGTKWVFKPIDPATGVASTDANTWITIPKAVPDESSVEILYSVDDMTLVPFSLDCLPDSANKDEVLFFGDGTVSDTNESGF